MKHVPEMKFVNGRIVLTGYDWEEMEPPHCIHGTKLRWQCDYCDEDADTEPINGEIEVPLFDMHDLEESGVVLITEIVVADSTRRRFKCSMTISTFKKSVEPNLKSWSFEREQ